MAVIIVSNISDCLDIGNFLMFLEEKGIRPIKVEYIYDEERRFTGQSRVIVAHEDKLKTLEALKDLSIFGKKLEVVKEKELQKRDPLANIRVRGLPKWMTQKMFFDSFNKFG